MSFDLAATLRRLKPSRAAGPLIRRNDAELPFTGSQLGAGPELLLDSTVYIDILQDRAPAAVERALSARICNHSSVCVAELTHLFGRLDPAHPGTAATLAAIRKTVGMMRPHRVRAPSQSAWGAAGILAGLAFRLGNYGRGQEPRLLNDALIYLQALENGQTVLTGNVGDFDALHQLLPEGRILLYRRPA